MLEKLTIKNYLLLKNIEIDFSKGFNVITGETGAGKTILVNALSLLFGERADYSVIKKNNEKMIVEGFIKLSKRNIRDVENFISGSGAASFGEQLIVRRELYSKGYSRTFVNDSPVNINDLKTLGEILVDVHSQNEHQSLLKKEIHIEILDAFILAGDKNRFLNETSAYRKEYSRLVKLAGELDGLVEKKKEIESKREFLEFQLKEIKEVNPVPKEDEELEKELLTGENSEGIRQSLTVSYGNLYEEEGAVLERLKTVQKELSRIQEYNSEFLKILKEIGDAAAILEESSRQLQAVMDNFSFDPERLESMRERLYKLQFLKKKYGNSLENVLKLRDDIEKDLKLLDNFDESIEARTKEIDSLKAALLESAKSLSGQRKKGAELLEKKVTAVLNEIGLDNAEFRVIFGIKKEEEQNNFTLPGKSRKEFVKLAENGIDDVEFLIKVNKGDDFSPLNKTASGGEISRIMLAIKTVLSGTDKVDILIFDEIDTGISGRIAQKVGKVLKKLSTFHQVISVSHLAQIAALADDHFLVEKESGEETTEARIRKLDDKGKVFEVAKLLSGEKVTDTSMKSARELIEDRS